MTGFEPAIREEPDSKSAHECYKQSILVLDNTR